MRRVLAGLPLAVAVLIAGCGEKVQTVPVGAEKRSDVRGFQITDNGYLAPGWTPGNESSWEAHLKQRAQAQNDFAPRQ
jgi:hypothetical protein